MKQDFENELNEFSPLLADLKKRQPNDGFLTPKYYFDTLADKVLERAKTETTVAKTPQYRGILERFQGWLSALWQPRIALAMATFALVASAGWYAMTRQKPTVEPTVQIENVAASTEEIHQYITTNIEDFDENLLLENAKNVADTEGSNATPAVHPKSGLSEKELEKYLEEHLDDTDLDALPINDAKGKDGSME